LASWLAIYHCVITCNFECKRLKRLVTWAAYLSGAAATDCDEPPSFTSRLERLRRLTVNSTVLRCHAACPTFTLRQVDDLVVLRPQHRLLLMTVLRRQTDRQTDRRYYSILVIAGFAVQHRACVVISFYSKKLSAACSLLKVKVKVNVAQDRH